MLQSIGLLSDDRGTEMLQSIGSLSDDGGAEILTPIGSLSNESHRDRFLKPLTVGLLSEDEHCTDVLVCNFFCLLYIFFRLVFDLDSMLLLLANLDFFM